MTGLLLIAYPDLRDDDLRFVRCGEAQSNRTCTRDPAIFEQWPTRILKGVEDYSAQVAAFFIREVEVVPILVEVEEFRVESPEELSTLFGDFISLHLMPFCKITASLAQK